MGNEKIMLCDNSQLLFENLIWTFGGKMLSSVQDAQNVKKSPKMLKKSSKSSEKLST